MKQFYVGIDLGGSNIRTVVCDENCKNIGDIRKESVIHKTEVMQEAEENLIRMIDQACKARQDEAGKLAGIGIAMAALFERKSGVITKWPNNNKWNGFPIKNYLEKHYKVPIVLEDDANAAVLGEQLLGAGKGRKNLIYVTISTGIGCGIIANGSLLTGEHGWAGELGHIKVSGKKLCTCGAKGCLQAVASGPAIVKAFKMTDTYDKYFEKQQDITLKDVVVLAKNGKAEAMQVFEEAGRYIGTALANLVMMFDVPIIILGGGVMNAGELITRPMNNIVEEILKDRREVKLVNSWLNDQNGVIGALSLINKYVNQKK